MKISNNWLKDYLEFDLNADETADALTLLGLEVDDIETIGGNFDGFVVGEVLEVKSHPNADRLTVCSVNTGSETVQIVCGAKNVAAGQKVPVATVGSTLPVLMEDGSSLTIKKAKLRGEVSEGMICSESELGFSDDHEGIMVLNPDLKTGAPLKEALKLEHDTVFEIGLTPNRPDAACHIGVARDLGARIGKSIKNPYEQDEKDAKPLDKWINIEIKDTEKCHRYAAKIVEGVQVGDSPAWLQNRLRAIGLRPINNVVDATNYVMHEIGQPLHAFDYTNIAGKKIVVQSFDKVTEFTTLDDQKRKVPANTLFICDGEKPVAVAGVMGGLNSEVTESTKTILIESAYFEPSAIRKASKQLTLQTDSSYRFERGIDPNLARRAADRAAKLISELAGGTIADGCTDNHPVKTEPKKVTLRISRVNQILGTSLKQEEAADILKRLEFGVKVTGDDTLECLVPTFRPDVTREIDLIEEVGRVFDYNNIPKPTSAPFFTPAPIQSWEKLGNRVRDIAVGLSYKEITTNSLLAAKEENLFSDEKSQITTLNPVSQDATTLRSQLTAGFLKTARYNLNRNEKTIRFFESGHVYSKDQKGTWFKGIREHSMLLLGICGYKNIESWNSKPTSFSFFDLKSDVDAFFAQLGISELISTSATENQKLTYSINDTEVAVITSPDKGVRDALDMDEAAFTAEIDITLLHQMGFSSKELKFTPIPKFPAFEFDAAFVTDTGVRAGDMTSLINKHGGSLLQKVQVFDVYEGENLGKGKKSIAFRLTFLDRNKTLNIKDVEPVVQKIVQAFDTEFGAKLRS
jgi:phenylalanyl-tRNA synthetase beta chain